MAEVRTPGERGHSPPFASPPDCAASFSLHQRALNPCPHHPAIRRSFTPRLPVLPSAPAFCPGDRRGLAGGMRDGGASAGEALHVNGCTSRVMIEPRRCVCVHHAGILRAHVACVHSARFYTLRCLHIEPLRVYSSCLHSARVCRRLDGLEPGRCRRAKGSARGRRHAQCACTSLMLLLWLARGLHAGA
jgi:hypothetical protein